MHLSSFSKFLPLVTVLLTATWCSAAPPPRPQVPEVVPAPDEWSNFEVQAPAETSNVQYRPINPHDIVRRSEDHHHGHDSHSLESHEEEFSFQVLWKGGDGLGSNEEFDRHDGYSEAEDSQNVFTYHLHGKHNHDDDESFKNVIDDNDGDDDDDDDDDDDESYDFYEAVDEGRVVHRVEDREMDEQKLAAGIRSLIPRGRALGFLQRLAIEAFLSSETHTKEALKCVLLQPCQVPAVFSSMLAEQGLSILLYGKCSPPDACSATTEELALAFRSLVAKYHPQLYKDTIALLLAKEASESVVL